MRSRYPCLTVTDTMDPRTLGSDDGGPPQPARRRGMAVLSGAGYVDRILTWGIEPNERAETLQERESDRFEHISDPDASMASVVARSVASSLSDVWYRFVGSETSALPLAAMFAIIGVGALADGFVSDIPPMHAFLNVVTGIGYLAMAAAGLRQPRKLKSAWLLPGLVLASSGTMGGAIVIPVTPEAGLFAWIVKAALVGVATGLAVVAVAFVRPGSGRVWIIRGGGILWGSALLMAVGAVGWTIADAPIESTRWSSLMVAFACVVGAAVIARLRNIEVA